jgi:hypothetical protein
MPGRAAEIGDATSRFRGSGKIALSLVLRFAVPGWFAQGAFIVQFLEALW